MQLTRLVVLALTGAVAACTFDPSGFNADDDGPADGGDDVADAATDAPIEPVDAGADAAADAADTDAPVPVIDAAVPVPDAPVPDAPVPDAAVPDAAVPDAAPVPCGDGTVEPLLGEQCDDGNGMSGDGCSGSCKWEAGACYAGAMLGSLPIGMTVNGSTSGQSSGLTGGGSCGGASSGEDIFVLDLAQKADVNVTTELPGTNFRTSLYVRTDCDAPGSQLGCASAGPQGDGLTLVGLDPGSYFVVVDGFSGASGNYALRATIRPVLGLGDTCDPAGVTNRCDNGLTCAMSPTGVGFTCQDSAQVCADSAKALTLSLGVAVPDMTSGTSGYQAQCGGPGTGPEDVFSATVTGSGARDLVVDVTAVGSFNPVVSIDATCGAPDSSLACSSISGTPNKAEAAVVANVAAGTYFPVVDGAQGSSGSYSLSAWLRDVAGAGAGCDRPGLATRCNASVCVDTEADLDTAPSCTAGLPVENDNGGNNTACIAFDGPRGDDFVYTGAIGPNDADVIQIIPAFDARLFVTVLGANGTCPVDMQLSLFQVDCMNGSGFTTIASDDDSGLGACPFLDTGNAVKLAAGQVYWLNLTRAVNFGSGSYTMVVDFVP